MQSVRPCMSMGAAIVGASLIAVTPATPPPADIQQVSVQLASSVLDLTADLGNAMNLDGILSAAAMMPGMAQDFPIYSPVDVFTQTFANLHGLGTEFLSNPFPILQQIVANQLGYAGDLFNAGETAASNLMNAVQDIPTALQNTLADLSQGDFYDAWTQCWQFLLNTDLSVISPLVSGASQVVQGVVGNLDNVVQGGQRLAADLINPGFLDATPQWLSALIAAPLYGPNAAITSIGGVVQDIINAASSGRYETALTDVLYAPSTIAGAFLNGYPVDEFAQKAALVPEAIARMIGINPAFGLLTNPVTGADFGFRFPGTFANILSAREIIASDLGAPGQVAKAAADAVNAMLDGHNAALPDLSAAFGDLSSFLNPATALGDFGTAFSGAVTDVSTLLGADLAPNLSGMLLGLF